MVALSNSFDVTHVRLAGASPLMDAALECFIDKVFLMLYIYPKARKERGLIL